MSSRSATLSSVRSSSTERGAPECRKRRQPGLPASFDLGEHLDVALLSVPEGDDKPQKYPVMFRAADVLLLSKCDLLGVLPEFYPG